MREGGGRGGTQVDFYKNCMRMVSGEYKAHTGTNHGGINLMERHRGVKMIYSCGEISCVHHIDEKECTARFATGAI